MGAAVHTLQALKDGVTHVLKRSPDKLGNVENSKRAFTEGQYVRFSVYCLDSASGQLSSRPETVLMYRDPPTVWMGCAVLKCRIHFDPVTIKPDVNPPRTAHRNVNELVVHGVPA